jgi:hypothetical protein
MVVWHNCIWLLQYTHTHTHIHTDNWAIVNRNREWINPQFHNNMVQPHAIAPSHCYRYLCTNKPGHRRRDRGELIVHTIQNPVQIALNPSDSHFDLSFFQHLVDSGIRILETPSKIQSKAPDTNIWFFFPWLLLYAAGTSRRVSYVV